MNSILAIDPGNRESAWCLIDCETRRSIDHAKQPNDDVRKLLLNASADTLAIEMVASYGMSVGADVFETCVWIGRFLEVADDNPWIFRRGRHKRLAVKTHHCHDSRAKDTNVRQALVDRFAPGEPNHGKGTKAEPGWFHGFAADIWQAYALAVYVADTRDLGDPA